MKHETLLLPLFSALALATASSLHAQMLLNGSFEGPALPANSSANNNGGSDWTPSDNATVFLATNGAGIGMTPYGNQWLGLSSGRTSQNYYPNDVQSISGSFALNGQYQLSLVCAAIDGKAGDQLTIYTGGGAPVNTYLFDIPARAGGQNSGALPFVTYTIDFSATSSDPVLIQLTNTGYGGGALAVDNVVLSDPAAVPEPSTWTLLGVGVGLLGLCLRRRHRV